MIFYAIQAFFWGSKNDNNASDLPRVAWDGLGCPDHRVSTVWNDLVQVGNTAKSSDDYNESSRRLNAFPQLHTSCDSQEESQFDMLSTGQSDFS